jgi:predicted RNA binding protein YcfA (HicA-like mRNA interferase family)
MAARDKTLERMRANPRDWRIEDLEALARYYGFVVRKPGGSHAIFTHERSAEMLSVPARRPIKPVYVRRFVALIDSVKDGNEGKA